MPTDRRPSHVSTARAVRHAAPRLCLLAALIPTLIVTQAPAAFAQTDTPPKDSPLFKLPAQTVTARKRVEDPLQVPISMSIVNERQLEEQRIDDVETLLRLTPNVGFSSLGDARSTYLSIRGIGPMAQPLGHDDTSVVIYVDGVPQPLFTADQSLLDVERVEIMRGPQGTLFGRNAQGGAIHFVTRKPTDEPEADANIEAGSQGYRQGRTSMSGALVKGKLKGRLAFSYNTQDGDVDNLFGSKVGDQQRTALRGSLVATPDADTTLTLGLYLQRDRNTPSNFVPLNQDGFPIVALSPEGFIKREMSGLSLTAEKRLSRFMLTSVTAWNHYGYDSLSNNSEGLTYSRMMNMPLNAFNPATDVSTYDENQNTFHQELRLSSLPDAPVAWVGGLNYYFDNYHLQSYYRSSFFASTNGWRDVRNRTNSYAAFGEVTTPLGGDPRLKLTAGLRYTRENRKYSADYLNNGFPGNVPQFAQSGKISDNLLTGRLALSYALTPSSTVFASMARGAKSGGFPNFTQNATSGKRDEVYKASKSWTYEVGSKNRLFNDRVTLNATLFYNDVKDENLRALDNASFSFIPKSIDTRSYGAELETSLRLLEGLELMGSLGYTHATLRNVSAEVASSSGARDGNRVPSVPRFNAALGMQYRLPGQRVGLPGVQAFTVAAQYQYIGAREADVGANFRLQSYSIVNARVGVQFANTELYVFGRNLGDKRPQYIGLFYGRGSEAATIGQGRIIGAGLNVHY